MSDNDRIGFFRSLLGEEEDDLETAAAPPAPVATESEPVVEEDQRPTIDDADVHRFAVPDPVPLTGPVPAEMPEAPSTAFVGRRAALRKLKDPDPEERKAALRALAAEPVDDEVLSIVSEALADPEVNHRSIALRILEREPGRVAVRTIETALLDVDAGIRSRALALLGRSRDPNALLTLAERIRSEDDEAVCGAGLGGLARSLSEIDPSTLDASEIDLIAAAIGSLAEPVQARYRREVGIIASSTPAALLRRPLISRDADVRRGAAILASESGEPESRHLLEGRIGDPDPVVQALAKAGSSEAAGEGSEAAEAPQAPDLIEIPPIKDATDLEADLRAVAIPALLGALRDPDVMVRQRAEDGLRAIEPERIDAWILDRLSSDEDDYLVQLAEVAARFGLSASLVAIAEKLLAEGSPFSREQVAHALRGAIGVHDLVRSWSGTQDVERRILALRLMGLVGGGDPQPLLEALDDPSATVRCAAAEAADVSDDRIASALLSLLKDDSSSAVRSSAAAAFLRAHDEMRLNAAAIAMTDPDVRIRVLGVDLAAEISGSERLLAQALQDADPSVASRAGEAITVFPGPEALAVLWSALRDAAPERRGNITSALLQLSPGSVARLAAHASASPSPQERALGLSILVRLKAEDANALIEEALCDPSVEVRRQALQVLIDDHEGFDLDAVGRRVRDPDHGVRGLAVELLASIDDDRTLEFLLAASHDPVEEVRGRAREAILARASASVAQVLVDALSSTTLRRTASDLLIAMGSVAIPPLVAALEDADPDLRWHIGETLSAAGAQDALRSELTHRDPSRRLTAVEALGAMRATDAVNPIIERLSDPDGTVRARAADMLAELGDVRAVEALKQMFVSDPDMEVVAATERALRKLTGPSPDDKRLGS